MREQDGEDVGMCMGTVEQVRSRRSSEDASVGEQEDTAHKGTDSTVPVWPCAACRIVSSVRRQVSSARLVDVKSQTERARDRETFKTVNQHRVFGPRLGSVQPPSTRCMHARMHAHTRTHVQKTHTKAKCKQTRYTMAGGRGKVSPFPLQAGPGERASGRATS